MSSALRWVRVLAVVLVQLTPLTVRAQTDTEVALAETLYRQARDLMAAGNLDEACPKFAESYRLDRATGTMLNLAACYEKQGKLASAWLAYSDGMESSRRDGRADRVKFAADHLAALEPQLARIAVVVPPEADAPDLALTLDGAPIGRAARGVPAPVDPGRHVIEAKATGKQPFSRVVEITAPAQQETVTIPPLTAAPGSVQPPPTPPVQKTAIPPMAEAPASRPIPASVWIAGGTTAALVVGAAVTGGVYLSERADYNSDPSSRDKYDSAHTLGVVNAWLWGGAAVGAAVTTYLYLTRPEVKDGPRASFIAAPGLAGLAVSGGF